MKCVSLGEVVRITGGGTPSKAEPSFWSGEIPWASVKDLKGSKLSETQDHISELGAKQIGPLVPAGTVITSTRMAVGRSAITTVQMAINQDLKALHCNAALEPRYLLHFLNSKSAWFELQGKGATVKGITLPVLLGLNIPLPPLPEQRRIADILDRADALKRKRQEAIKLADDFLRATFLSMFGSSNYPFVSVSKGKGNSGRLLLTDVARLATGHTPDRSVPEYWNGVIPWITLTDIRSLDGSTALETSESVTELGIRHSSAVKLPAGTVCFSRTASVGFVTMMGREMCTSQDFVNWVCGPKVDPRYLMHALIYSRTYLKDQSTGSTHKTIYFPTVERFELYLPPIEQQHRFAEIADTVAILKGRLNGTVQRNVDLTESLTSHCLGQLQDG